MLYGLYFFKILNDFLLDVVTSVHVIILVWEGGCSRSPGFAPLPKLRTPGLVQTELY